MKSLTNEEMNIAICEWLGWTPHSIRAENSMWFRPNEKHRLLERTKQLPDHITGPEALGNMHEAEERLAWDQLMKYADLLCDECSSDTNPDMVAIIHLTAEKRALAFLRVVKPEIFK